MSQANLSCRICGAEAIPIFHAPVLAKHNVAYFECSRCRLVQTEHPYWLSEAYAQSINVEDTGVVLRNQLCAERCAPLLLSLFGPQGRFVDYAGGYGLFTRMMRDRGFNFYWHDAYTENLIARGFEYSPGDHVEAVTTFESFEHFVDPLAELQKLLALSDAVIFSTELAASPAPQPNEWWYYGLSHGQHIAFFRPETLQFLAEKTDAVCASNDSNMHCIIKSPRLPYCLPHQFYSRLSDELGPEFAHCYRRVDGAGRAQGIISWPDAVRSRKRRGTFYVLKNAENSHDFPVRQLRSSTAFVEYLRHLLTSSLKYWEPPLKAMLVSRTQSDMELMAARRSQSR